MNISLFDTAKLPLTSFTNNNIAIIGNRIKLPKLGLVSFANSQEVNGKIVNCTITKTCSDKYYVSVCCADVEISKYADNSSTIGIDLGIKNFAITSDAEIIDNPRCLYKLEKKLKREQRKLSRKKKGSNNRKKQRIRLNRVHEKIANQRNDFLQKTSSRFINENQVICLEALKVKNMVRNHCLAKSISDVSWSEFVRMLKYKALWHDRIIQQIDTFYPSSQLCSNCGYKNPNTKDLKVRQWTCPDCGHTHDRDVNAAINILNEGLRLLSA